MQIKIYQGEDIEKRINDWLNITKNIYVIKTEQSTCYKENFNCVIITISIYYKLIDNV